ncbi:MAG: hypothetical protein HQK79_22430 [Desulfobacterales bacterium]|nr:hypothetical protein [Desulfobacterales bacterium]
MSKSKMINYDIYRFLTSLLFIPIYSGGRFISSFRRYKSVLERFGNYPQNIISKISGSPRIWIHAVSVGEVGVAEAIINQLKIIMPNCSIIISTTTPNGLSFAMEKIESKDLCIFAPLDFVPTVKKAINSIKPDIMVFLETEIWPNWFYECKKRGIKTALINGRISSRSIKRYLKIKPLLKQVLKNIDTFSMICECDANRIKMLGAPNNRISINGNAKYDLMFTGTSNDNVCYEMAKLYKITSETPVFVAGSTRGSEDEIVIDAYRIILNSFPKTILILAPRHINKVLHIQKIVNKYGFSSQLHSELQLKERREPVVIVDTIGELKNIYSIASVVFCGGSIAPLGGQNILEPAVWGKMVFYGPNMDDFLDAKELLESVGAGIMVKDSFDISNKAVFYLKNQDNLNMLGRKAREAILAHCGSSQKHANVIYKLLFNVSKFSA